MSHPHDPKLGEKRKDVQGDEHGVSVKQQHPPPQRPQHHDPAQHAPVPRDAHSLVPPLGLMPPAGQLSTASLDEAMKELTPEEQLSLQQQAYAAAAMTASMGNPLVMMQQMMPGSQYGFPMMFPTTNQRKRPKLGADTCSEKGCTEAPIYSAPRSRVPKYCKQHKRKGMKDVVPKDCAYDGCTRNALWNHPEAETTKYCGHHKEAGMIDLTRSTRKTCAFQGCNTQPSFNHPGSLTRQYCAVHKAPGMVLVGKSRACEHPNCTTRPTCNVPGTKSPRFCAKHKLEGMIDVKKMSCAEKGCTTQPFFNFAGATTGMYCNMHFRPGMVDIRVRTCLASECSALPTYNFAGFKAPRYCANHKSDGMVIVKAAPGGPGEEHKLPPMHPPQPVVDHPVEDDEEEDENGEKKKRKKQKLVTPPSFQGPTIPGAGVVPTPQMHLPGAAPGHPTGVPSADGQAPGAPAGLGAGNYNPLMSMMYGMYNPMMYMEYNQLAAMQAAAENGGVAGVPPPQGPTVEVVDEVKPGPPGQPGLVGPEKTVGQ